MIGQDLIGYVTPTECRLGPSTSVGETTLSEPARRGRSPRLQDLLLLLLAPDDADGVHAWIDAGELRWARRLGVLCRADKGTLPRAWHLHDNMSD